MTKCKNCGREIEKDTTFTTETHTVYIHTNGMYACNAFFAAMNNVFATPEGQEDIEVKVEKDGSVRISNRG